ncbi:conserved hypothetical protein [Histoplasma capsulatum var. duboisii H88]|uniref:Uncharacterized protein n=2 Tax=Ajellomyces capsulatus (strain H88) TaxID=544711 RepID=F0UQN2_AJEC8|nr:conserved hypothetical protein [Histoplasma capsulatum var. duboisii H88]
MDSVPRDIPGYYYDAEKNKYFKIQANHTAPLGSKYSRDVIKQREQTALRRKRIEDHSRRVSTETIKRSNMLHYPLGGKLLQRECGTLPASRSFVSENCAAESLGRCNEPGCLISRGEVRQRPLDWDSPGWSYLPNKQNRPWQYKSHQRQCNRVMIGHDWAQLAGFSTRLPLFENIQPAPRITLTISPSKVSGTRFYYNGSMIRCSAACPSLTDSIFVVSNSSDLLLITRTESTWAAKDVKLPNTADVMSVEWLTPRVVIAGMNNSLVQFFDLRSQDTVSRLQHPHGVYKIRKVDEWRIVMAGAKKNLHMYDLRYASSGIARHPQPNKPNHTSTKPYISFHEYENDHISHDELDVSPEIGLLACTSPSKRIQLFSLSTGKLIMPPPLVSSHSSCLSSTPNTPLSIPSSRIQLQAHQGGVAEVPNPNRADTPITYYQYQDPITCLRFENLKEVPTANGAGNTGKPSLLVSAGNIVEEWRM